MAPSPASLVAPRSALRALLQLAWPIVLARSTQAVIGFCDALMVAPLGEEPLAAATTGAFNAFVLILFPMGMVFIVQSFAAQLRGRGQVETVQRYAWYGLILSALAGLIALVSVPLVPWVLGQFSYSTNVHALMSNYLSIRLLSVGLVVGTEALGNWYGGLGHTRPAMFAGGLAMVVNLAGNYLLIEPRFGLPGYGVEGAAVASVVASGVGFLALFVPFLRGMGYDKPSRRSALRWSELLRVVRFGLPNGVNWFLEFAAFMLFINVFVADLGTTALAAFTVVLQINSVAFMPAFGFASAGAIVVGEAIGRGAHEEVRPTVRLTATVASAWTGSVGLVYVLFPGALMGWFGADDGATQNLVEVGATMLMLAAVWQLFDAVGLALSEALRAAGDTAWCMAARIALAWLVFMPAAWIGMRLFDGAVVTVMVVVAVYVLLLAVALGVRFRSDRWRSIELIEAAPRLA